MKKDKKTGKIEKALGNSMINYMSDLFVVTTVIVWIFVIIVMIVMSIYAEVVLGDVYMWSDLADLVGLPLTAGGALWMFKNSVQHVLANYRGERAHMDFPKVPDTDDMETETEWVNQQEEPEAMG